MSDFDAMSFFLIIGLVIWGGAGLYAGNKAIRDQDQDLEERSRNINRYRKKPVEVEAFRYDGWKSVPLKLKEGPAGSDMLRTDFDGSLLMTTIHGEEAKARIGDWVILENQPGRFYPCQPDIFAATYEPA